MMLAGWTDALAAKVSRHLDAIINNRVSSSASELMVARRTNGLPVYGDLGGVIALTLSGEFVLYGDNSDTVAPVQESLWEDVALASLGKHYPDLRELLPDRPADATVCPNCSGTGWMMGGRLFCRMCRGLGWVEDAAGSVESPAAACSRSE
jgi:hypothetical protein